MNEDHEKVWIIRVTKNQCLDFLKRSSNKNKSELDENIQANKSENFRYVTERSYEISNGIAILINDENIDNCYVDEYGIYRYK